jgi:hypothetical protein
MVDRTFKKRSLMSPLNFILERLSTMRAHLMPENAQGGKPYAALIFLLEKFRLILNRTPLTLQPTEQFHDFGEAHSDRHKIFGLSFSKCVA